MRDGNALIEAYSHFVHGWFAVRGDPDCLNEM